MESTKVTKNVLSVEGRRRSGGSHWGEDEEGEGRSGDGVTRG